MHIKENEIQHYKFFGHVINNTIQEQDTITMVR